MAAEPKVSDIKKYGLCDFGEDIAHGAGCIKAAGHVDRGDPAHCVTPGDLPEENW
ncbi:hypothetical protein [Streptomyces nanshensis]|uniref:hypothetical protein n=1 Tax=Streptomyces nanshensis TaxID=518642 RepID=UPI001495CB15|nr:hypothetical protein [Streptomyces nanshensis]